MVQLSPDTRIDNWDGSSGYHYSDDIIYGFSHTHLSGTGIPDGCDILFMPTVGERIVHMGGYGDTFGAFQSEFGPMSGLICGENSNPLAVFSLIAEGTRIHVMSWPNHFPTSGDPLRNRVAIDSQAFAQMSKAFVVSACGHSSAAVEPAKSAAAAVQGFMQAVADSNLDKMASLWGTASGSAAKSSAKSSAKTWT